ncbi:hypothetical protein [Klugiella xanthotipulae]|uniref:Uncharacterized protein n=1 Tax=Klugiella xanthotipulae TaxID=244735 RepID=A0A543HSS7_9MICO|nr:hypothetical protein [Klugiella xanthotipulae]TQM61314.1 hypothetical protein FB466_2263 [Klugiella xanthotipulae]
MSQVANLLLANGLMYAALLTERGVTYLQGSVPGRAELGDFAFNIGLDGFEEVDVPAVRREDAG